MEDQSKIDRILLEEILEKVRATDDYKKIKVFKKAPEEKAKIIKNSFRSACMDIFINEGKFTPMDIYLKHIFEIENVDMKYLPAEEARAVEKKISDAVIKNEEINSQMHKKLIDHKSDQLNAHDRDQDEEFTGTIIIPEPKNERRSPIQEGRIGVSYISKKELDAKVDKQYPFGKIR